MLKFWFDFNYYKTFLCMNIYACVKRLRVNRNAYRKAAFTRAAVSLRSYDDLSMYLYTLSISIFLKSIFL